jgi:hypothetical protein
MKDWMIALAVTSCLPLALTYIAGKLIPMLKAWEIKRLLDLINAKSGDPDLDAFEKDLILALAKLGQKKFPKDGFGPERKKLMIDLLVNKVPYFRGQEARLSALIDQIVESQAAVLDAINPQPAQPQP